MRFRFVGDNLILYVYFVSQFLFPTLKPTSRMCLLSQHTLYIIKIVSISSSYFFFFDTFYRFASSPNTFFALHFTTLLSYSFDIYWMISCVAICKTPTRPTSYVRRIKKRVEVNVNNDVTYSIWSVCVCVSANVFLHVSMY